MLVNGTVYYVHTYERHKLCGLIGRLNSSTGGKDYGRGKAVGHKLHKMFLEVDVIAIPWETHIFFFSCGKCFSTNLMEISEKENYMVTDFSKNVSVG